MRGALNLHLTTEELADAATSPTWDGWQSQSTPLSLFFCSLLGLDGSNPVKTLIEFFDPTPIGAGMALSDGLIAIVDPFVSDAQAKRQAAFDKWVSPD